MDEYMHFVDLTMRELFSHLVEIFRFEEKKSSFCDYSYKIYFLNKLRIINLYDTNFPLKNQQITPIYSEHEDIVAVHGKQNMRGMKIM